MSKENYQEALSIIKSNKDNSFFAGPREENLIKKAEKLFGYEIRGMYRDFLKNYGAGSFGGEEIFGVIDDDFENSSIPDAFWYTAIERREIGLPKNLLIIYDIGSGEVMCLDFNALNKEKEPAVVSFYPGIDLENQAFKRVANDFGEFLLQRIKTELEE